MFLELGKMSSLCEKIGTTIDQMWEENPLMAGVFRDINTVLMGLCKIQETILTDKIKRSEAGTGTTQFVGASIGDVRAAGIGTITNTGSYPSGSANNGMVSLGNTAKKQRPKIGKTLSQPPTGMAAAIPARAVLDIELEDPVKKFPGSGKNH
jgi:hypothetical protein